MKKNSQEMKRYSYTDLCLAFDDRKDKASPFFSHIITICEQSEQWWKELDNWWNRMNSNCRKMFLHYLNENDKLKFIYHIIDNKLKL